MQRYIYLVQNYNNLLIWVHCWLIRCTLPKETFKHFKHAWAAITLEPGQKKTTSYFVWHNRVHSHIISLVMTITIPLVYFTTTLCYYYYLHSWLKTLKPLNRYLDIQEECIRWNLQTLQDSLHNYQYHFDIDNILLMFSHHHHRCYYSCYMMSK